MAKTAFPKVFSPAKIKNLELKNRIVMPPMGTRLHAIDGFVSQEQIDYYSARAKGGPGLIVVEASYSTSNNLQCRLLVSDDKFIPGLKKLVDTIHAGGAKVTLQISPHQGRWDRNETLSASGKKNPMSGKESRALTVAEIERMVQEFGEGARRARDAGFDAVMVHAAHGYLVHEFLSPLTNTRTDQYGGDLPKRTRFALDLVKIARQKTGPNYPILIRMVCDERLEGGIGIKDAVEMGKLLQAAGVDAIDVVSGALESGEWVTPSMYYPTGYNVHLARTLKHELSIPIIVAGRIKDPYLAEEIIGTGRADFVDMGRAVISDPDFPRKMQEGRLEDIRRCIGCLKCQQTISGDKPIVCSVNAATGREGKITIGPAAKKKKVLVVGGGPGGLQTAVMAAQRGHDVTIWERKDRLGGLGNIASIPPGKEDIVPFINYLIRESEKAKVKLELGREATVSSIQAFKPDAVVVAAGSRPIVPKIEGLSRDGNVVTYVDVLSGKADLSTKVAIIGGGYVGCETALYLVEKGHEVSIVELLDQVANDAYIRIRKFLLEKLNQRKVKFYTGVKEEKLTNSGLLIKDKEGKENSIEADSIVISCGAVPNKDLFDSLKGKVPELHEVGDCVECHNIQIAIRDAATAAMAL